MDALKEMAGALATIKDPRLLREFLVALLTKSEARTIALRWELVKQLDAGRSQRAIARELGVSLCKITRGSRELKKRNSALKKVVRQAVRKRNTKED